ncbi:MAG: ArnT family glycosyltransferase [Candidatus Anammoxibacter sp.]
MKINEILKLCKGLFQKSYFKNTALLFVVFLITATVVFRWHNIEGLPYGYKGMHIDTAFNSEIAFRIIDGHVNFSPVIPGFSYLRDSIQHYYLSLFYTAFGKSIFALRFSSLIISIINVLLLFAICRMILRKTWLSFGVALLFACSSTDTIFTYSAFEHVISTSLIMASFILLHKAVRSNNPFFYTSAGMLIGFGLFSSYYFIILCASFLVYLTHIAIFQFKHLVRQYLGLLLFVGSVVMASMPKIIYTIYNLKNYLLRIYDVSAVSDNQSMSDHLAKLVLNFNITVKLLFSKYFHNKWLLGENPVIDPILAPFLILSIILLLVYIRRPEMVFILSIIVVSFAINVFSYPMDYRFINTMPFFYLSVGGVFLFAAEHVRQGKILKTAYICFAIASIFVNYKNYQDTSSLRIIKQHYHTTEVQIVWSVLDNYNTQKVYYSIADQTWIPNFFMASIKELHVHPVISTNRLRKTTCNSAILYELHNSIYEIIKKNRNNIRELVFIFDDSICNREIINFLESQISFSQSSISLDGVESDTELTVLDNFRFFDLQREQKKELAGRRIKLKAVNFSPDEDMKGGIFRCVYLIYPFRNV